MEIDESDLSAWRDDWMIADKAECTVDGYIVCLHKYRAWCVEAGLQTSTVRAAKAYLATLSKWQRFMTCRADGDATGAHRHEFDYVVVPITGGTFVVTGIDGSERTMTQIAGVAYSGRCGTEHDVTNASGGAVIFVEVELKA